MNFALRTITNRIMNFREWCEVRNLRPRSFFVTKRELDLLEFNARALPAFERMDYDRRPIFDGIRLEVRE